MRTFFTPAGVRPDPQLLRCTADTASLAGRAALSLQPQWERTGPLDAAIPSSVDVEIDGVSGAPLACVE